MPKRCPVHFHRPRRPLGHIDRCIHDHVRNRFRAFWSSSGFLGTAVTSFDARNFRDLDLLFFAFAICPPK
jgi:hypothetical protein